MKFGPLLRLLRRQRSPSARREWIEIFLLLPVVGGNFVSLREEGVD